MDEKVAKTIIENAMDDKFAKTIIESAVPQVPKLLSEIVALGKHFYWTRDSFFAELDGKKGRFAIWTLFWSKLVWIDDETGTWKTLKDGLYDSVKPEFDAYRAKYELGRQ